MKVMKLADTTGGWFVGNFDPTILRTQAAEVAVKRYKAGDAGNLHYHHVATEITAILNGRVRMFDQEFGDGDIILIEPGEGTSFEAITDVTTVVVKMPSAPNDKYPDPPAA